MSRLGSESLCSGYLPMGVSCPSGPWQHLKPARFARSNNRQSSQAHLHFHGQVTHTCSYNRSNVYICPSPSAFLVSPGCKTHRSRNRPCPPPAASACTPDIARVPPVHSTPRGSSRRRCSNPGSSGCPCWLDRAIATRPRPPARR